MATVLILGGTSTIARAIAAELAARGFDLALAGRDAAELAAVAADLRLRHGITTSVHLIDTLAVESHAAALAPCLTPDLRGVVLAFGYLGDQRRAETDAVEVRRILDTNLTGCITALNAVAAHLAETGGGFVCALSSVAGDRGRRSNYVYGAAKGGLAIFLQGLRNRLYRSGVVVITLKPGFVDTPMTAGVPKNPLFATAPRVGLAGFRAIERGRDVVYIPWFWRLIMAAVKSLPESIFKRLRL